MSHLHLKNNGVNYGIAEYGSLGNLRRIMSRNVDNFENYLSVGNRPLPNQNPLVQFLLMFSVDVEWKEDYLINIIDQFVNNYASLCNFTSIYNRGKDQTGSLYPEKNHRTIIVVPYGKPSKEKIKAYFNDELNTLVPLIPIYTTDIIQRWDVIPLIDAIDSKLLNYAFTIVSLDPYSLVIGYWRWLRRNRDLGNSPHSYLMHHPIMNLYMHHNELVGLNYLNGKTANITVQKGRWSLERYTTELKNYCLYKEDYFIGKQLESFTEFFMVNKSTNVTVNIGNMIFPDSLKSSLFPQMKWPWTMAAMSNVEKYLEYTNLYGVVDGPMNGNLKRFFKESVQGIMNQINDGDWAVKFISNYDRLVEMTP